MSRRRTKLLGEGEYVAEVEVERVRGDGEWGSTLSLEVAERLDAIRGALRCGDVRAATKEARVYHLTPVSL